MDIVHHTLIGGAGYMVAASHGEDLAGMAFLAGSVFPDLDVVFIALGKRFYLRNHQGITHSLLLSPLYALLVTSPLLLLVGLDWKVLAGALAGLWVLEPLKWILIGYRIIKGPYLGVFSRASAKFYDGSRINRL